MTRFNAWYLSALIAASGFSEPAAAQTKAAFSSLTHVLSVTVPPRVKVKVSPLSISVDANRAWVLAVKSSPAAADIRLASSSASGATVVFRDASRPASAGTDDPIVLTISAP